MPSHQTKIFFTEDAQNIFQDYVVFVDKTLKPSSAVEKFLGDVVIEQIAKVAKIENFKGTFKQSLILHFPANLAHERLLVIGVSGKDNLPLNMIELGGYLAGKVKGRTVLINASIPDQDITSEHWADCAMGACLRSYSFDLYKTKKKDEDQDKEPDTTELSFLTSSYVESKNFFNHKKCLVDGANMARDLVNEPPNVLYPAEFAKRSQSLTELGVEVDILDEIALEKIGMRALLAVGQGSTHESRVVIMRWNGGKPDDQPLAFIGKGVTFDSGGISIKPAQGMEDMKGDMAGAACVVGLMHALASRKARVNVIGMIGLVENMPDGAAQRPGDIVTTLSGQTVEIINTDAEGRLVLADLLTYMRQTYKPRLIINLATLTGAILVALAQEHAGLFSNNDELADQLTKAGLATHETVWRMPLGPAYDKMIDSKVADMKNTGGRFGGSITAAQFLQRFVNDTPWVHLDIAGVGMAAIQSESNKSWGSGWGVRLLDQLIYKFYQHND